ncbi:DUF2914 domain-containing protein [Patescibacteria group bacterium]|nr:DUF2914 domain-containing protein [Patescibacteria group bacterium]
MLKPLRNFYGRFERPISSLSLISGFIFDAFTLKRVDTLWENIWIFAHLVVVGIFIILIHIQESEEGDEEDPSKKHFWYVNILQFFFGGILSTYLVFYFRSSDILTTWPFIAILALAFIANERLKTHYVRFTFQISLFFLSIYSFAIFLVPVVLHRIGVTIFLLSGLLSLIFINIFTKILFRFLKGRSKKDKHKNKAIIFLLISSIFIIVNILYFTNLIPPIPLSLKDAGAYHSVEKTQNGNYNLTGEDYGWRGYFTPYPEFHTSKGGTVYAFSSIFSPNDLNITIHHEWQYYDEDSKEWDTKSVINLSVLGGREDGFRTYSARSGLQPGKWRVNITNDLGQMIGHIRFTLVNSTVNPVLSTVQNM